MVSDIRCTESECLGWATNMLATAAAPALERGRVCHGFEANASEEAEALALQHRERPRPPHHPRALQHLSSVLLNSLPRAL